MAGVEGDTGAAEHRVVLTRHMAMAPVARRWARAVLEQHCPRRGDVELVVAELVMGTVLYGEYEEFALVLTAGTGSVLVEVYDHGPATPASELEATRVDEDDEEEGQRWAWSLCLVNRLSTWWGHDRYLTGLERLWAELTWTDGEEPA